MLASHDPSRTIALSHHQPDVLPRLIDQVVGGLLELMVHSVEGLRARVNKALR